MKIGIIGASLAGLTAGKQLALAGHDVTVIEKSRSAGGRLATFDQGDGNIFDYGISHFTVENNDFRSFVNFLMEENDIAKWASRFEYYDGTQLHDLNPNRSADQYYAAPNGMYAIARRLSRWVDVKSDEKAGGLTHIGADRTKKRAWMINLTDISTFGCDAVIIATPATEAYGVLQTSQDETPARRIIRHIDEINYGSSYTVMATYEDREKPGWDAIESMDDKVAWIINESSKRDNKDTSLVIHSTSDFARVNLENDPQNVTNVLLDRAAKVAGESWIGQAKSVKIHFWKYANCQNTMDEQFLELEMEEAPLALVGDYLGGNSVESAYLSGLCLAEYWKEKYELASV